MMTRCDGCWRDEKFTDAWIMLATTRGYKWDGDIQLCPACAAKFDRFLERLHEHAGHEKGASHEPAPSFLPSPPRTP
jgi:hypothetical protein